MDDCFLSTRFLKRVKFLEKVICDLRFGFVNQMNMIFYFKSYKSNHVFFNLLFRFTIQFFFVHQ